MAFESLEAFLNMGGHAKYVWLAYGFSLLLIGGNLFWPIWSRKSLVEKIKMDAERARKQSVQPQNSGSGQ